MQGILIINKEKGYTSQDVVSKVKRILNIKKAGHTGTLDPMATGVLPVLLGNYTKLSKYLIEHDKIYEVKLKFGEKRDTGDSEGKVIEIKDFDIESLNENKIFDKSSMDGSVDEIITKKLKEFYDNDTKYSERINKIYIIKSSRMLSFYGKNNFNYYSYYRINFDYSD